MEQESKSSIGWLFHFPSPVQMTRAVLSPSPPEEPPAKEPSWTKLVSVEDGMKHHPGARQVSDWNGQLCFHGNTLSKWTDCWKYGVNFERRENTDSGWHLQTITPRTNGKWRNASLKTPAKGLVGSCTHSIPFCRLHLHVCSSLSPAVDLVVLPVPYLHREVYYISLCAYVCIHVQICVYIYIIIYISSRLPSESPKKLQLHVTHLI